MTVLGIAALRDLSRLDNALPWRTMDEFADFYCAGWAIDQRADPYRYEPLHACEHRVNVGNGFRAGLFASNPPVAVPAPQPPFDFMPYAALARLPAGQARIVDGVAILAAVAACAAALAALGVPLGLSLAALALSVAYVELNTAQIVPFALLALVLGGLALARGRYPLAGVLLTLTAIEPSAGLPVIAATLLFVPRARVAVVATALFLALVSSLAVGPAGVLEYLAKVLPAHAGSELHFPFQYSLTSALVYVGLDPTFARIAGALSYVALVVFGLVLAPRTSAVLQRPELLVFLPALSAVVAGPFLHQEELCFALPALLILAISTRGRIRTCAALALCALAVPWILVWGAKQLFLASIFVCAAILLELEIALPVALGFLCLIAATIYLFQLHPPHLPLPAARAWHAYLPNDLVQTEWRDYTNARSTRDALWFAIKLPTWAALIGGLAIAARCGLRPRPAFESSLGSSRESRRR
jgi:Glycosyltransferase family 87